MDNNVRLYNKKIEKNDATKILMRKLASKIFLILLVYKNGKTEKGEEVIAYRIGKLIYSDYKGKQLRYFLSLVQVELSNLEMSGLITKDAVVLKNGKLGKVLRPNIDKFVDLFIEYFNLNLTEEEKLKFKEWFKKVDWRILIYPYDVQEYLKLELHGNIFEWIGAMLSLSSKILSFYKSIYKELPLNELREKIKNVIEDLEKENKDYADILKELNITLDLRAYLKMLLNIFELPEDIISKLREIKISTRDSQLIEIVFNTLALEHALSFILKPLFQKNNEKEKK